MTNAITGTVDTPLEEFVAVVEAAIRRIRDDYDLQLVHSMVDAATLTQRCKRCGYWIQIGDPIKLVERKGDPLHKDWIHQNCPRPVAK